MLMNCSTDSLVKGGFSGVVTSGVMTLLYGLSVIPSTLSSRSLLSFSERVGLTMIFERIACPYIGCCQPEILLLAAYLRSRMLISPCVLSRLPRFCDPEPENPVAPKAV